MPNKKGYTHIGDNIYSLEPRYRKVQDEKYFKKQHEENMVYLNHKDTIRLCERLGEILEIKSKRITQYKKIIIYGTPLFCYGTVTLFKAILDLF